MSNEDKLLLYLSCKEIDKNSLEKINHLFKKDLNWDYFIGKAIHNRVIPQLYINLRFYVGCNKDHLIPKMTIEKINRLYYSFIGSSIDVHKEATNLFQMLNKQNVIYAPIKGILLAETVYPDKLMRFFEDVDLLLPNQKELKKTKKILKNMGYERSKEAVYLKRRHDMLFKFDMHSSFSIFYFFDYPPQLKDFWELSTIQEIGGVNINVMSGDYMLLLLCLHSFSNGSLSLRDLSDSIHILERYPAINWDFILQRTEDYPCAIGKPLQLLHLLITTIFDEPFIPEKFLNRFKKYFIPRVKISKELLEEHVYPFPYLEICPDCEKYAQCKLIKYISFKEKIISNQAKQKNSSKMRNYMRLGLLEYDYIFTIILKKYGIKFALKSFIKENKGILFFIMNKLRNMI